MSTAQMLLRRMLDEAGGPDESGYVLVLECEGLESLPDSLDTSQGRYSVHRPATEIGLRHTVWRAGGAPFIAVVAEALARRLPADITRRARNQRVHALALGDILSVVLGVQLRGADDLHLQQLAMENLEQLTQLLSKRTLPTVVDRALLVELLVDASVGDHVRQQSPASLLARWVAEPPRWSEGLSRVIVESLPQFHGDLGRVLAWALAAEGRLERLVVHGALLTVDSDEVPQKAWGPLWKDAGEPPLEMDRGVLRRTVERLVADALAEMEGGVSSRLLEEADRMGRQHLTPSVHRTSPVLPQALKLRCHDLAQQAASGQPVSAADVRWLGRHSAAGAMKKETELLEALARLSRYLAQPDPAEATGEDTVVQRVVAYQQQGAFADLAAKHLMRALAGSTLFHAEADRVLAAYRERRDRENLGFASTLARGYEAALNSDHLVPLQRVTRWVVAPVWESDPGALIYLVVLDGCSYPVFLELLYELAQDGALSIGAATLDSAWDVGSREEGEQGLVRGIPCLSPLPTVTSHSRGALMLGEIPNDPLVAETVFRSQEEPKTDKARFKQNDCLGVRGRRLLLKGDLTDHGQQLRGALRDGTLPLVAAVFNAVDDQIGSANTGAQWRLTPGEISGFVPSLKEALDAGRRVLLTSDHGHSPYVHKDRWAGAGANHRHAHLDSHQDPPKGFIEIDVGGLGGGEPCRRAFAWKMGAYQGKPQVGFHGGCSLEEMVVPLAWIVRDGVQADEPSWWFGARDTLDAPSRPRTVVQTPEEAASAPVKPPKQADLFNPADYFHRVGLSDEQAQGLSADERTVLVLLEQNGTARASEIGQRLGKNPMRVNGLMVRLRRSLSATGATRFSNETLPSGETLYRYVAPQEE